MQSEEPQEPVTSAEPSLVKVTMTFSDSPDGLSSQLKSERPEDIAMLQETKTDFDEIDLEDDIEKVEESSIESSSATNEDSLNSPKLQISDKEILASALPDQNSAESVRGWLQRISEMQNEIQKKLSQDVTHTTHKNLPNTSCSSASHSSRVVKYQDLPYMGEMTLDNSKPRRGRKPKKADICHLIYKNYGTIFPGTPNANSYLEKDSTKKASDKELLLEHSNKSDVQNRIISSLLEKRLTQEHKRTKEVSSAAGKLKPLEDVSDQNEPLNLCIRDLNHLKIRFLKNDDNTYTSEIKVEPPSDDEADGNTQFNFASLPKGDNPFLIGENPLRTTGSSISKPDENGMGSASLMYWPNAGIFIHPMALQQQLMYYQRLAAGNNFTLPSIAPKPPPSKSVHSDLTATAELKKSAPKPRPKRQESSEDSEMNSNENKPKRNASSTADRTPTKRKRSAIFIPPIPTENNTNPATEVSICKFKFTGGAKPSLQEKKMLSVDSGGNFRYYSGTGDKSMRGYEFFPRETLQQQVNNAQGSSTGAFLQASGEKIYPTPPPEFARPRLEPELLISADLERPALALHNVSSKQKKRKTKKSMQREKLEQTFKEKGFLIQTQQLESAEGATYCKFRQLRKFTRYLFRSWKDYLPGNVRELQEGEKNESDVIIEQDFDNLARHSTNDFPPTNLP